MPEITIIEALLARNHSFKEVGIVLRTALVKCWKLSNE